MGAECCVKKRCVRAAGEKTTPTAAAWKSTRQWAADYLAAEGSSLAQGMALISKLPVDGRSADLKASAAFRMLTEAGLCPRAALLLTDLDA